METNQDKTLGEFLKDMGIADKDIKERCACTI